MTFPPSAPIRRSHPPALPSLMVRSFLSAIPALISRSLHRGVPVPLSRALLWIIPVAVLVTTSGLAGQVVPPPSPTADSVMVVPADYCRASRIYATLAGAGYRTLWETPIKVPVADLGTLGGGGITPMRVGGGMTTQTLHATGADGRRYVFRSVQKETQQALAEEFWGTPVETLMRDQLCSFHPTGAIVVARLLEAVGVLHPEPRFMVLPDDPRLEEFREQFAGMLVLFEERPDDGPDGTAGFGNSRKVSQTDDLLDELEDHPLDRVDLESLLRSRLVDLLVGDRDRSINNYLWARYDEEGGKHYWRPVPRDRDQAFVRFDGWIKALGRNYDPRLVSFGPDYSDIKGLTRNAWDIDRNLLVGMEKDQWDVVVTQATAAITDSVIAEAVRRMPPEHFRIVGPELETGLRQRRDHLPEAARGLYEIVFRQADIHATDEDELAVVTGLEGGGVRVSIYSREDEGAASPEPHFRRTFFPDETKELRLYMHGGDDRIRTEGSPESPILLRVVGGGGGDHLANTSGTDHLVFYDDGGDTRLEGEGGRLERRDVQRPYSWWTDGEGELDFGESRVPEVGVSFDGDRGLVVSLGFKRDRYGFLAEPYASRLRAKAGWAVGRSAPILEIGQEMRGIPGGGNLLLRSRYSGFEVVRFYGLGNETRESASPDFYEVHQKQFLLSVSHSLGLGRGRGVTVGPVFRATESDTTNPRTLVTQSRAYGTGTFLQAGLQATVEVDKRDLEMAPTRGFHLTGGGAFFPSVLDVQEAFGEVHGELAAYLSPSSGNPTLALRAGGKRLWGRFPFSDAAFIGGSDNVRGLREQRFAGRGSLMGAAELRVFLTRFFLLFPIDMGIFGFSDAGRVFADGESSTAWHTSVGGGVWLAPVSRRATVQLSVAESEERRAFYVGMGFAY